MAEPSDQELFVAASRHQQAGRLAEADAIYRDLLSRNPRQPELLHRMGVLAFQKGEAPRGIELIERAISLCPNEAAYHGNLGMVLASAGRLADAIAAFRRAIELKPDYPEAHHNLGTALNSKQDFDGAAAAFARAAALRPESFESWFSLGNALRAKLDFVGELNAMQRATQLRPDSAQALAGLGNAQYDLGRLDDAVGSYRQAAELRPDDPELLFSLGTACLGRGLLDEAERSLSRAIELRPNYFDAMANLGLVLKETGRPRRAIELFKRCLELRADPSVASNILFTMQFSDDLDPQEMREEHERWDQDYARPLSGSIQPHRNSRDPRRQLRIGYVSPDFRNHAIARFMLPLLIGHARGAHKIFCYSDVRRPDAFTELLASKVKNWRATARLTDEQLAAMIRADEIDILVDLAMHTSRNRLLTFARKPAPVQVTYLAYCGTTGLSTMDYRLTDPSLDPPDMTTAWYSEKSVGLPHTYWCYRPPDDAPPVGPPPVLTTGRITFGCFNNFSKISPSALATWAELLAAVPSSRLFLHAFEGAHRERVSASLSQAGIDPARLEFTGYVGLDAYYKQYHRIDIALDPFPYAGGTSTCDALWMGVPVVTLAGPRAVSRGGVSILSNIGLPELIAQSREEYIRIASQLASDTARLGSLRTSMRERMRASPLMNAEQFTLDVETAYRQMWQNWCATK